MTTLQRLRVLTMDMAQSGSVGLMEPVAIEMSAFDLPWKIQKALIDQEQIRAKDVDRWMVTHKVTVRVEVHERDYSGRAGPPDGSA